MFKKKKSRFQGTSRGKKEEAEKEGGEEKGRGEGEGKKGKMEGGNPVSTSNPREELKVYFIAPGENMQSLQGAAGELLS